MAEYSEISRVADRIMEWYASEKRNRYQLNEIHQIFHSEESSDDIRAAFLALINDKYLAYDPDNQRDWAVLTIKGEQFYIEGGYESYYEKLDDIQIKQDKLEAATLDMATAIQKTSNSIEKNFKASGKLYWLTLLVGAISTAATVRTCQNNYQETKLQKSIGEKDSLIQSQQRSIIQITDSRHKDSILIDSLLNLKNDKTKQ